MAIILMILIFINWLNFYGPGSFTYKAQYFDFVGISTLVVTLLTLISAIFYFYENGQLIWQMMKRIFIFASK